MLSFTDIENSLSNLNKSIKSYNNGTLTFSNVGARDAGQYQCEANNGLGKPLRKMITLTVHGKVVR